jgi:hypothetical protein
MRFSGDLLRNMLSAAGQPKKEDGQNYLYQGCYKPGGSRRFEGVCS